MNIHWKDGQRIYDPLEDRIRPGDMALIGYCGHIAHKHCMANWYEVDQRCPHCRKPVDEVFYIITVDRIYPENK